MKCLICNKEFRIVNSSHLKTHSLTVAEYEKMFPNVKRFDEGILESLANKNRIHQTGKKYSEASKAKMSRTRKAKIMSGEIITPFMTEDKHGKNNPAWGKNRRSVEDINKSREKSSKSLAEASINGYRFKYGKFYSEKLGETFHYRSSYELRFFSIIENTDDIIHYDYEPLRIPYKYDGITHIYIPDFLLTTEEDKKTLVEVGTYTFKIYTDERTEAKHNAAIDYCILNNINFFIVTERELEKMENMENRTNCWKALKPICHNVIGNDKRDGLKNNRIYG